MIPVGRALQMSAARFRLCVRASQVCCATTRSLTTSRSLQYEGSHSPLGLIDEGDEKYIIRYTTKQTSMKWVAFIFCLQADARKIYVIQKLILRSPYPDVTIPECNVADFVWKDAASYPDEPALVCGMTGRQYTYEMAQQMSVKFGSALRRLGAQKGDVVAMILPNLPEFPIGDRQLNLSSVIE